MDYYDRAEAHERVSRYYEIMGSDPPSSDSQEYREQFALELERVREGREDAGF